MPGKCQALCYQRAFLKKNRRKLEGIAGFYFYFLFFFIDAQIWGNRSIFVWVWPELLEMVLGETGYLPEGR